MMNQRATRIRVVGGDGIDPQARTYAEYRAFAALARHRHVERIREVRVVLRRRRPNANCEAVACTVTVVVDGADSLRIRTLGTHAYGAINRAIERLRTSSSLERLGRVQPEGAAR